MATIEHKIDETDDHEKRQHEADKMVKKRKWPGALAKALVDEPWDYTLKLRTGDLIRFNGAEKQDDQGEWVKLTGTSESSEGKAQPHFVALIGRGLIVRVSEIVWCFDGGS